MSSSRVRAATVRRATAFAVVCGLLLGQLLGLAHRIVHVPGATGGVVSIEAAPASAGLAGLLTALLPKHEGVAACDAFDHASVGAVACDSTPPALPLAAAPPAPPRLAVVVDPALLPFPALARGPPLSRSA